MSSIREKMTKGFSLIELSIVLVITSLIVAGVVIGKSLVRQAEIQSVVYDVNAFRTATNTFYDQYNALPGDMNDAEKYWPGETANGNGDNWIGQPQGYWNSAVPRWKAVTYNSLGEGKLSWQHLALSGMVKGNYTGEQDNSLKIGETVPGSSINNGAYGIGSGWVYVGDASKHFIVLGRMFLTFYNWSGVASGAEANNIDRKMDDGKADSGNVMAVNSFPNTGCIGGLPNLDPVRPKDYILSNDNEECLLYFSF